MICPKCSRSEMWDNTEKVKGGWNGPLFKCKDKTCDGVIWPPKGERAAPAKAVRVNGGAKWTWDTLASTYDRCLTMAEKALTGYAGRHPKAPPTCADVLAATATLFIAASRDGVAEPRPISAPPQQAMNEKPAALAAAEEEIPF